VPYIDANARRLPQPQACKIKADTSTTCSHESDASVMRKAGLRRSVDNRYRVITRYCMYGRMTRSIKPVDSVSYGIVPYVTSCAPNEPGCNEQRVIRFWSLPAAETENGAQARLTRCEYNAVFRGEFIRPYNGAAIRVILGAQIVTHVRRSLRGRNCGDRPKPRKSLRTSIGERGDRRANPKQDAGIRRDAALAHRLLIP